MKTVIEMAREAGFFPDWNWDRTNWHAAGFSDSFERFATLVRAAEREACAKVCESLWRIDGQFTADEFAAEVRTRGNT